jgi:hypothetical protein
MDTKTAAQYLGVTVSFLEQARFRHVGPQYLRFGEKKGCSIRYRQADLDEFVSISLVSPNGQEAA